MRKIIVLLTLALVLMYSTVAFASCILDTNRWKWIDSNDKIGMFYDNESLKIFNDSLVQTWLCYYYPNGCRTHDGEHYHYFLTRIDYSNDRFGIKAALTRDSKGNAISNSVYPDFHYELITPNSVGEIVAKKLREDYEIRKGQMR